MGIWILNTNLVRNFASSVPMMIGESLVHPLPGEFFMKIERLIFAAHEPRVDTLNFTAARIESIQIEVIRSLLLRWAPSSSPPNRDTPAKYS